MSRQLLTLTELASILNCSRSGIYYYTTLPPVYTSSRGKFWSADEIRIWMYGHLSDFQMEGPLARLKRLTGD